MEKDYGAAIDLWSVGCIFAELIDCQEEHISTSLDRKPLFPGESCFPISPGGKSENTADTVYSPSGLPCSSKDQIAKILSILGTPTQDDLCFISDNKAIEYIETFPKGNGINLQHRFPAASSEAIDFLSRLLIFNPFFRMNLSEAIAHPLFDDIRATNTPPNNIAQNIDIDFENEELNHQKLKELILKEVQKFKQSIQE